MKRKILAIMMSACILAANGSMTVLAEEADYVLPNERQEETLLEDAEEMTLSEKALLDEVSSEEVLSDEELPVLQLADGTIGGQCGDNLTWTLDAQGLLTISGSGNMKDYTRDEPSPWHEYDLRKLKIEKGVTSIGAYAFSGCSGFTGDLVLPDGVLRIGKYAFNKCSGFTGDLILPNSLVRIDDFAFSYCKGFNGKLVIPNGVTMIWCCAFLSCSGFTGNLTIPESVYYLDDGAFRGCSGFTGNLTIPSKVDKIDMYVFMDCSGFTGDLTIPSNVTAIQRQAFKNCTGLTGTVTIPASVKEIGNEAFSWCTNVTKFVNNSSAECTLPSVKGYHWIEEKKPDVSITTIASGTAIRERDPILVSSIRLSSTKLNMKKGDTFPVEATIFPSNADNRNVSWTSSDSKVATVSADGTVTAKRVGTAVITATAQDKSGVTASCTVTVTSDGTIVNKCGENLIFILDEDGLLTISGTGKMYDYTSTSPSPWNTSHVKSLKIEEGVNSIGDYAFYGCSDLTGTVSIPASVTTIGKLAFCDCDNVTKFINKSSAVCELPSASGYHWIKEGKPDVPITSIASGTAVRVSDTPEPEKPSVNPSIAPPNFGVKGVIGGRTVTFTSDTKGAVIYYSTTTSNLTTSDIKVANGGTVTFENYYGSLYARAYYNGQWSNVSRLILRIPVVNDPTITQNGSKVTIRCSTPDSIVYYTLDGSTPSPENGIKIAPNKYATFDLTSGTVKAIAVRSCFTSSKVVEKKITSSVSPSVKVPSFKVVGVFGGREVTFTSEPGAIIYYSTSSTMTSNDAHVNSGGSVVFSDFYGTIYARSYKDGKWSNPARLILKIPTVNTPTVTDHGNGYVTLKTTTPDCYLYYTTDGSTPSMTNGNRIAASASKIYVGTGKTVKVIAVRSCFTNSKVTTLKTK